MFGISRLSRKSAALLLLAPALAAAQDRPISGRVELERHPVGDPQGHEYLVVIGPCDKKKKTCPVNVELVVGKKKLGAAAFGWKSGPGTVSPSEREGRGGKKLGWAAGEGEDRLEFAVTEVPIAKELTGLVITGHAGFEHVKRQHALFVMVGKKPKLAWGAQEGQGPWGSWVESPERGRLSYTSVFRFPGDDGADTWSNQLWQWNAKKGGMEEVPRGQRPPVFCALAGTYDTVQAARKAQAARDCLKDFLVLDSGAVEGLPEGKFPLAALSTREDEVEQARARAKGCEVDAKIQEVAIKD